MNHSLIGEGFFIVILSNSSIFSSSISLDFIDCSTSRYMRGMGMEKEKRTISIRLNDEVHKTPETHKESAAAEEREFEWILPERRDAKKIVELKKRHSQKKVTSFFEQSKKNPRLPVGRKKKKHLVPHNKIVPFHKKVIASAVFAIALGVLFGFGLLMVFGGESVATPIDQTNEAASVAVSQTDLSLELHVVQSGAYETEESAREFQDKLKDKGLPATIFKGEKYFLLIGVSPSAEGQDALATYFESNGQEVYKKLWTVDGKKVAASEDLAKHLKESKELIEQLTTLDLVALSDGEVSTKEVTEVKKAVQTWNDKGSGIKEWEESEGQALAESLNAASKEIENYSAEETVPSLWMAQQHLLDALATYQEVVKRLE